jgi:hypothetical protein
MRKSIKNVVQLTFAFSCATPLQASISLPDLPSGSQYQLLFVTADYTTPTSDDINYYNEFVTDQADLNPLLPITSWHAIASTATVDANINAPWLGLPVYNTQGQQVNHPGQSLYVGNILNPVADDQYGNGLNAAVWTGSSQTGTGTGAIGTGGTVEPLGTTSDGGHTMGITHTTEDRWLTAGNDRTNGLAPLYALSAVITVGTPAPEPASILIWGGITVVGIAWFTWQQRNGCA